MRTLIRARFHELRCTECRVTWRSWAARSITEPFGLIRRWIVDHTHECRCACVDNGVCGPCWRCGR